VSVPVCAVDEAIGTHDALSSPVSVDAVFKYMLVTVFAGKCTSSIHVIPERMVCAPAVAVPSTEVSYFDETILCGALSYLIYESVTDAISGLTVPPAWSYNCT